MSFKVFCYNPLNKTFAPNANCTIVRLLMPLQSLLASESIFNWKTKSKLSKWVVKFILVTNKKISFSTVKTLIYEVILKYFVNVELLKLLKLLNVSYKMENKINCTSTIYIN